jgi:DnaJ family protein A protein 2
MIQQVPTKCGGCNGTGSQISEKDRCTTCSGERTIKEKKTLEVFVTRGMRHGERITFKNEADESPDATPGDVVVVLQQVEHPTFKREGANLFTKRSITLIEALTGFNFLLTHLDGRVLRVQSEPGMVVKPGQTKCQ